MKKTAGYYYGSTQDIDKRIIEHNSGKVAATKIRMPFRLHYLEEHSSRKEAVRRELFFKKRYGHKWLKTNQII